MSPQPSPTHEIPVESLQKETYIRTYAMDLANASAKNTPSAPEDEAQSKHGFFNSLKTSLHSSQGDGVHEDPQTADSLIVHDTDSSDPDLAVLEREAERRDQQAMLAQKEISDELSSLTAESTKLGDFSGEVEIKPTSTSFIKVPTPPEQIQPQDLPRKDESAAEPSRESILERLRNRASEKQSDYTAQKLVPIQPQKIEHASVSSTPEPVEPLPVPPTELTLPTPEPEAPAVSWSLPTIPVAPEPEVVPQREIAPAPVEAAPEAFHSFSTDFADQVDTTQASTFSVLAAQNDAPVRAEQATRRIEWLPIFAGVVLIVGAGAGVTFAYQFMQKTAPITQSADTIPSLITPDEKVLLTGDNLGLSLNQEMDEAIPDGHVLLTYIRTPISTAAGTVQVPQSGEVLFGKLGLDIPSILLRNVEAPSSLGIIHAGNETRPFFLLKVSSYQRTFLGMLDWESTIAEDFSEYYPAYDTNQSIDATAQFTDDIVASHSVRVLRDAQGRSILMYGYTANKEVLIIARDEAAFTILLSRLSASGN